jgi:hypothetical protein
MRDSVSVSKAPNLLEIIVEYCWNFIPSTIAVIFGCHPASLKMVSASYDSVFFLWSNQHFCSNGVTSGLHWVCHPILIGQAWLIDSQRSKSLFLIKIGSQIDSFVSNQKEHSIERRFWNCDSLKFGWERSFLSWNKIPHFKTG